MKNYLSLLVVPAMLAVIAGPAFTNSRTPKPNVIILLSDDQGYGDLLCQVPALDEHHRWDDLPVGGIYPVGKAIDISKARFSIRGATTIKPVAPSEKSVSFESKLEAGTCHLQFDFLNNSGEVQCGAYYVEIVRIN